MTEAERNSIALFRYGILAPFIQRQVEVTDKWSYFSKIAEKQYEYVDGTMRSISASTLCRWYDAYQKDGFDALKPARRSDSGTQRKIDGDLAYLISYYIDEYPRLPATQIYDSLKSKGDINPKDVSLSTVTRYVTKKKSEKGMDKPSTEYRRYEKEHINEVWYGDTTFGPYLTVEGKKMRVYIIALIDDASRKVVACEAFFEDNFINLLKVIKSGISTCGKPKMFSFDNGANYRSVQMNLLGARIGVGINFCPPFTPTSKAKVERFFRTLKDQYLCRIKPNDYSDLGAFNKDLKNFIHKYNTRPHSSLGDNISPNDRFYQESKLIVEMSEEQIEKSFLLEIERKVSADGVVNIDCKEYEVDYSYQNQKILLRYSPDMSKVYVVDRADNSMKEIKLLDKKANGSVKREKARLAEE